MSKISVIMGIYQSADKEYMVKEAIDSIFNQTVSDFEFIICDDGSSDYTFEMVERLIKNDKRCILIRNKENKGLAYTLNHCLKYAKGEYVARMDADDISLPQRLEKELELLDKNPRYSVVGCCAKLFNEKEVWGKRRVKESPQKQDFLFGTQFMHPTVMVRRKVYEQLKGYSVNKNTILAEDYEFFMRLYAAGFQGYNLQEELFLYRENKEAYKRRTYKRRIAEAKIRYQGFKRLGLLPKGYPYVLKPLIVGMIPRTLLLKIQNQKYNEI